MPTQTQEIARREALGRAISGQSFANYSEIFNGFMAKGIPEDEIRPRENVFTYQAWQALGRQVRKGEHGVRVCTFVRTEKKEQDPLTGKEKTKHGSMPHWTTVFHISQTDKIEKE